MDHELGIEDIDRRLETVSSSIRSPFGTWPLDKYQEEVMSAFQRTLIMSSSRLVGVIDQKFVVKISYTGLAMEPLVTDATTTDKAFENELKLMKVAGDCSVAQIGRVFDKSGSLLCGFFMPLETSLVPPRPPNEPATLPSDIHSHSRKKVINELCALVARLHTKGVIHGDIKPSNLLRCSDGELRFCDFEFAALAGRQGRPLGLTERYASPTQNNSECVTPLSFADDLYSTGISIWEIYTGCVPFVEVESTVLQDVIAAGVRPDISKIDNSEIAHLVSSYLDRGCGDQSLIGGIIHPAHETCIVVTVAFKDCRSNPPHTYSQLLHSVDCSAEPPSNGICAEVYRAPGLGKTTEERLSCNFCGR